MDDVEAEQLFWKLKGTDQGAKKGHGIGFGGVGSPPRSDEGVQDSLHTRFRPATTTAKKSDEPQSVRDRIRGRVQQAMLDAKKKSKAEDCKWEHFTAQKRRELVGLQSIVDDQGRMVGSTYEFSERDHAELANEMAAAKGLTSTAHDHKDAIFGIDIKAESKRVSRDRSAHSPVRDQRDCRRHVSRHLSREKHGYSDSYPDHYRDRRRAHRDHGGDLRSGGAGRERDRYTSRTTSDGDRRRCSPERYPSVLHTERASNREHKSNKSTFSSHTRDRSQEYSYRARHGAFANARSQHEKERAQGSTGSKSELRGDGFKGSLEPVSEGRYELGGPRIVLRDAVDVFRERLAEVVPEGATVVEEEPQPQQGMGHIDLDSRFSGMSKRSWRDRLADRS